MGHYPTTFRIYPTITIVNWIPAPSVPSIRRYVRKSNHRATTPEQTPSRLWNDPASIIRPTRRNTTPHVNIYHLTCPGIVHRTRTLRLHTQPARQSVPALRSTGFRRTHLAGTVFDSTDLIPAGTTVIAVQRTVNAEVLGPAYCNIQPTRPTGRECIRGEDVSSSEASRICVLLPSW